MFNFFKNIIKNKNNSELSHSRLRFQGAAAFDYSFMQSIDEKDYPKYLSQAYYIKTGNKLNLKHPKDINEKIQWLKIYDNSPLKAQLTDKIIVRDWIKDKIGEEYLKPVLWTGKSFDYIPFESLPLSFIIKANHGCKWNVSINNKDSFLASDRIYNFTRTQLNGWLEQNFFYWSDFETQYKNIEPKLLIEPLLKENNNYPLNIEVYCFNSTPKIIQRSYRDLEIHKRVDSTYDEKLNNINLRLSPDSILKQEKPDDNILKAVELSKILSKGFKFVRIDFMVYNNRLYFEEMTFTPQSGYIRLPEENKDWYLKLGNMLNLKGE